MVEYVHANSGISQVFPQDVVDQAALFCRNGFAFAQSRRNTPEFMAIFADVVRKLRILQTTKHMWEGAAPKWRIDIQAICDAKVEHFEQLAAILARHGQQSMPEMMRAAAEHKLLPLFKALQYVTFQTANIPLTQGYKMSLRQLGFALNLYDGPLSIFLTTNFADMYSPMNGAGMELVSPLASARSICLTTSRTCRRCRLCTAHWPSTQCYKWSCFFWWTISCTANCAA